MPNRDICLIENPDDLSGHNELGLGYQFCTTLVSPQNFLSSVEAQRQQYIVFNQIIGISKRFFRTLILGEAKTHQFLSDFIDNNNLEEGISQSDILSQVLLSLPAIDLQSDIQSDLDDIGLLDPDLASIAVEIEDDVVIYREFRDLPPVRDEALVQSEKLHGSPPFTGMTNRGDVFFRLSAFRNDRRIISANGLFAGSYATSNSDLGHVPNALHAVGRYALPNPVPPIHVFEITPPPNTPILFGTVTPQHNQAGGGAEVEFQVDLPPGSVVYKGTKSIW